MKPKLLLFAFLFGFTPILFAQPTASFVITPTSPCVGQPVLITDMSVGTGLSWSYTFSPGNNSTLQNPTTTFTAGGVYTISLLVDDGTFTSTYSETVEVVPLPPIAVSGNTTVCIGSAVLLTATGADSYTWNTGPTNSLIAVTPSVNTTYSVMGTNTLTGCMNMTTFAIVVNPLPTITVNSGTICSGSVFTITPSGALSYTYSGGSEFVSPGSNSSYTVTGEDANGCMSTAVSDVTVMALPTLTVNSGFICNGSSFTINPSGALSYSVTGGSFTVSPSSTSAYTVTGTDNNGCISLPSVSDVTVIPLPTVSVNSGTICSGQSFSIIPAGAFSYVIGGGSSLVSPITTTTYPVTGLTAEGCPSGNTAIAVVVVNPNPVVSASGGSFCAGGSFTIVPAGASSYTISGGSFVVSPAVNTTYTLTGTSSDGCLSSNQHLVPVVVNSLPVVNVNSGAICTGQVFTMVPSGASTYTFSGGPSTVSPVTNTSYSVTGTSTDGCVSSTPAVSNVTVNSLPVISVNSGSICAGQVFTITPSGASTFTYSGGSATVNPVTNTSYSVTGTSAQGCVSSAPAVSNVTVNALPVISVNSGAICNGQIFTMIPSGAATFTFSNGSSTVNPSTNTSYSVSGTSALGCISAAPAVSNVTVNALPVITVNSGTICSGGIFTMTPTGASTFTFSNGSATVNPVTTSSYSVSGTSTAGCVSAAAAVSNVTVIALPVITVNNGTICAGQVFTMVPSGASTYTYSNGSATVNPLTSSSYSVTGTSTAGCVSAAAAVSNVTVNALPVITVNSGTICAGQVFTMVPAGAVTFTFSNGSATVNPVTTTSYSVSGTSPAGCVSSTSGVSTVTVNALPVISVNSGSICAGQTFTMVPAGASSYTFSNGSPTVSPVTTSQYSVSGTSSAGCVSSGSAVSTVTVNAVPVITVNSGTICSGKSFTIIPSGAATYTYSGGSATVSPLTNTSYSVTGTSSLGCVSTATAVSSVTVIALPVVSVNSGTICSGSVFTMVPSGASTYTFSSVNATVNPVTTTSYSVTGTSTAGCVSSNTAVSTVTVFARPVVSVNSGSLCIGNTFTMIPSGASTYVFSNGSATVSPITNTSYSVTGTSTAGCISATPAISSVTVVALPVISITSPTSICSGNSVTLTASGGATYLWSTTSPNTTISVSPATSTTYSVLGTSAVGCTNSASQLITVNVTPTITVNSGAICPGNSFTLTPSGGSTYIFQGGSNVVTPLVTTNYTVTGTSAQGCPALIPAIATVSVVNTLTVTISGSTVICSGQTTTLTANGASTYSWIQGPATNTIALNPLTTTGYTVIGVSGSCTNIAITSVSVNTLPVVTVNSGSICAGSVFTITPAGAVSYTFSSGTATVSPASTSGYSVFGTDANGCANALPAVSNVTVFALPVVSVNSGTICSGSIFTIVPAGASTYSYSSVTATVAPAANATYSVFGTDVNGCVSASAAISGVTVNPNPTITVNSGTVCAGSNFVLTPTGAVNYSYSGGSATVTPVSNSNYTVTGSDNNGCTSAQVVSSVTVYAVPVVTASTSAGTICAGEAAVLTAGGASNYTWTGGGTGSTITVTPTVNTTYTVTGADVNGCTNSSLVSQVVDACTGVSETKRSALRLFPNPSGGIIYIEVSVTGNVSIHNSIGQVVAELPLTAGLNEINLSQLDNGIYLICFKNGGELSSNRFIKQ